MAEIQQVDQVAASRRAARDARTSAKLAREIGAFAEAHGGAEGQLAHLGRAGTRIVLVGEDGGWGDLVAPSHEIARSATERAGITVHESLDGDFAAKMRTGPYEWTRMAGIQLGGPSNG
ncbi:hypothetical protein ACPXCE_13310 [Streptomyces sp. DT24]|uniref:hypothetical protein n=1 Tax=unclassified Streptomyces TaxID=2593676 RepID=UPI0023B96FFC|nr:hypothetical protein [Streptomyces sp. AM 4-1-1]WEH32829.1 hypothetical protein PZB75_05205 [Streptomyces sp. AM 4-1-1]